MSYPLKEISAAELARQRESMARVAALNAARGEPPLALVDTYGCQQNEADSEKLRGMLREMGYVFTDSETDADLIVVNTCAVREHAEQRVLGNVGALNHTKRAKPEQRIALCGCMVTQPHMAERVRRSYPIVDLIFGTHELYRFPELLEKTLLPHKGRVVEVRQIDGERVEGLPSFRTGRVKAWLSVMYGCNNFCSYCVVPYVRGRERSRRAADVLDEARQLIDLGYKEITLLGQNVNSYGRDLDEGHDFAWLLEQIDALPGEFVIRFMTSHPKDATDRLVDTMAACEKVERHIHLPFQSGSSRVLKAMNRGYTREQYIALAEKFREKVPGVAITSDVIVGFPGETEAEFEETLSLVERLRFDMLFTFIYSPRKGTPAAALPDPFSREEKQKWFDRLLAAQSRISAETQAAHVGQAYRVLIDGVNADGRLTARTRCNRLVLLDGPESLVGSFADVTITESNTWSLCGERNKRNIR